MAKTIPPPFPHQVEWCVVYRDPERAMPERWRLYVARGSYHGASHAKSEAMKGNARIHRLKGFLARAAQHELDHLDGVLITDRRAAAAA